ncbi:unnamed protein product [Linum tenue]|uniref:Uncharacterized protein n=1 Tax=Linum tenue TaxID=586396 RepID=A0AAV0M405_9ROSI|nr:unnamed protein product [Linum tenue]
MMSWRINSRENDHRVGIEVCSFILLTKNYGQ